ncbi:MAG: hypothetical protein ACYS7Y_26935 [Planctomycetota bacterium]|jgi:hypothetical protein
MSEKTWGVVLFWLGFALGAFLVCVVFTVVSDHEYEPPAPSQKQIELNLRLEALDKSHDDAWKALAELEAVINEMEEKKQ